MTSLSAAHLAPEPPTSPDPVVASPAMREAIEAALDVASTPITVLLLGESGTGKELFARFLHARSGRSGPWVAVNCAALPGELLESELFGHEKGAFTGAAERRAGKFEQAHRGTLLLDEISELPFPLQAKLLRVIQEREVDRVGGGRPVPVDVRIIATTNRDLAAMVRRGEFRSDLYYRLDVFPIVLPPLRARREDVPDLARALLAEAAQAMNRPAPDLDVGALEALRAHPFPGNVRELRNALERALVRCRGPVLEATHLRLAALDVHVIAASSAPAPISTLSTHLSFADLPLDLSDLERLAITEALRRVKGNRTHAARLLGIGLRTLRNKLRMYRDGGIEVEPARPAERQPLPCGRPAITPIAPVSCEMFEARASHEERS